MDTLVSSTASASPLLQVVIFIYRRIGEQLGLDPSMLLTIGGVLWGIYKLFTQLWDMINNFQNKYLRCRVTIRKGDPIYDYAMQFVAGKLAANSRHLAVETCWKSAWDRKGENNDVIKSPAVTIADDGEVSLNLYNFADQAARSVSKHFLLYF